MQILEIGKKLLCLNHRLTLLSRMSFASIYVGPRECREAERLETYVMEAREKMLCVTRPDTLVSMTNLASNWKC
ncbi:hypothetical protein AOQ84DRAFT_426848 [Glonium stellatum]|uniref:Uncharacterized protein n=1 Tax=Glonium stellatum TaxID=574774 RepID=A0A8E2F556_9PEZI|nr:hypothetical protein AOQ84DRAFT_426848 [Glonium stellatum]